MNLPHRIFPTVTSLALLLSLCLVSPFHAAADLASEVDQALSQSGAAGDTFDAAPLLRLQALVRQARTPEQRHAIESRLVAALGSDIPWSLKQDVGRVLWMIGTAQSAPALKRFLAQPETVEIACYAIAENPVPELGQAVRDSLPGSTGKVALSLLNLLGQRRDAAAVARIIPFLPNNAPDVAAAATTALGKIGSQPAVTALGGFRKTVPQDRRVIADAAYLRAIESVPATSAIPLWKTLIATPTESGSVRREALLRLSEHAPQEASAWVLAALRQEEPELTPASGQALRNLHPQAAVHQVAAHLDEFPASSQTIVVEAVGHELPLESLVVLLRQPDVRGSALRMLGAREEPEAARALLTAALSPDPIEDRTEIFRLLRHLPGTAATDTLLNALPTAPAAFLSDLVQVLTARDANVPLSVILEQTRHGNEAARIQTIRALRFAATTGDHAVLFQLLASTVEPEVHAAVEETIADVFSHSSEAEPQTDWLIACLQSAERSEDRHSLLRLLAQTGTARALQEVTARLSTGPSADREAAFRALTQWPKDTALGTLLRVIREPRNEAQRDLAFRSVVRLLRGSQLAAAQKTEHFRQLQPLLTTPERWKLFLSGLAELDDAGAMKLIVSGLDHPAVRAEAAVAALAVASRLGPQNDAGVNAAMNRVVAMVPDAELRAQAQGKIRSPRPPLPDVYLDTLTPLKAVSGNDGGKGQPQINRNCIGAPLKLKGVTYERGIGEHAPAELTYALKPDYRRFVCVVGLDDQVARYHDVRGSIVVKILADDQLQFQTPALRGGGASANIDVKLPADAKTLRLVVEDAGDGVGYDDADFVYAGFIIRDTPEQPNAADTSASNNQGFTSLFDGRSFAGWEGNLQVFRIQDGAIVGGSLQAPVPRNEFLCTTNRYSDFELRLQFKLLGADANAGVQLRSHRVPGNEVSGYQADLGQTYWGNLYDESRRNTILVQADQTKVKKVLKPEGWNAYRIRCEGRRIQLWINDQPTGDYFEPDEKIEQSGIIGLQIHGGPPSEAWYKDVELRPLP